MLHENGIKNDGKEWKKTSESAARGCVKMLLADFDCAVVSNGAMSVYLIVKLQPVLVHVKARTVISFLSVTS